MKVRIMFEWAGNTYCWVIDWHLPFFPHIGETLEFSSLVDDELIKDFKNVYFKGHFKYEGLETNILGMLQNCYHTKIVNINWMSFGVEIQITTTLYNNNTHEWEELDKDE